MPDELEQYELHHRARIAIKPGITGIVDAKKVHVLGTPEELQVFLQEN